MATPTKAIRYTLKKNHLQGRDTAPYTARVRSGRTVGQDEIIATMAKMNASVSRQETLVVLDLMKDVITDILLAGNRASTDLFSVRLSLGGGFQTADDEYDAYRHEVNVRISPAAKLRKDVAQAARFERIRTTEPAPEVDGVYDHGTQSENNTVSPGQTAQINGVNLDYDRSDEAQGVFFKDVNSTTVVKAEVIHDLNASRVMFRVPEMVSWSTPIVFMWTIRVDRTGTYRLMLRRAFGSEIREGVLKYSVSVN